MNNNLIAQLKEGNTRFSKSQRRISDFIVQHYDKAAFMTAFTLGKTIGVSESTVVRFATELGYDGYPHMQRLLREMVNSKLTAPQRIDITSAKLEGRNVIRDVMERDIDKIRRTIEMIDEESIQMAVDKILGAKKIYILGLRTSSFLSNFLGFNLKLFFDNVIIVGGSSNEGDMFEDLFRVDKGDLVIGISYPRYSKRTSRGLRFASDRNADIISITDTLSSPIAAAGECTLFAPSEAVSIVDSFVAPLSLINALIIAVGMRMKDELKETFSALEEIWEEYDTYEKFENI